MDLRWEEEWVQAGNVSNQIKTVENVAVMYSKQAYLYSWLPCQPPWHVIKFKNEPGHSLLLLNKRIISKWR